MTEVRDDLQRALGASYAIERELGGGGMSRVFLAEDTRGSSRCCWITRVWVRWSAS
jgi:hypothetical protein